MVQNDDKNEQHEDAETSPEHSQRALELAPPARAVIKRRVNLRRSLPLEYDAFRLTHQDGKSFRLHYQVRMRHHHDVLARLKLEDEFAIRVGPALLFPVQENSALGSGLHRYCGRLTCFWFCHQNLLRSCSAENLRRRAMVAKGEPLWLAA